MGVRISVDRETELSPPTAQRSDFPLSFTSFISFPAAKMGWTCGTALTSVRHLSLSWASPIQSIYPNPTSCRSILILSTHLRLGHPGGLLPSAFSTKTLNPLSSPIRATCPVHLILLYFITRKILGEEYRSFSSSLCNLLHSPLTSSLLGPNILLNTIFSNTLSFLSSRNVNDQVSHPFSVLLRYNYKSSTLVNGLRKTTQKILSQYFLKQRSAD